MGDILFLAHRVPFPPNRGDKIRAHHLLKKIADIGPVHVGCFAESDEDRAGKGDLTAISASHCIVNRTKPLVLAGVEAVMARKPVSLTAFHSAALQNWVRATIAEHDVTTIVIFSGQMGQYVPDDFAGRVVIDLCDVDSAKFEGYAAAGQRVWINNREGHLLAKQEERLAHRADATILISDAEAELFRSRLRAPSLANVEVIGNGIDAAFFDPRKTAPHADIAARPGPHFVFTGQMDYSPNEAAALWAFEEFLPGMRAQFPDAELHIVGRNPTRKLLSFDGHDGITIWGEVPDVRPFIAAATCVVAPLMIARGVQNKVLEAMAMAKPVMLTPEAATGINAQDSNHWMMCPPDVAAMRARIVDLLGESGAGAKMGNAARQFVLEHHDWSAMLAPLKVLIGDDKAEVSDAA
ncbi:TIGR03087 family PEP-CTERM/XrtA system glycosyltransferase [Erythrobacter sp. Alg231-14]|uniref:TIGR03087 family PEP-CTERM/XrtA system glycosyltransferase n=1 Tax=Erythrobacter sp. Alg231-14 TaxID=1922225 RepID=UPI000D556E8A